MGPTISRRFVSTLKAAPLFTTDTVSGTITLSDSVAPGAQFSAADVTALSFTFFGITGTLADIAAVTAGAEIQSPALLIVGNVVSLQGSLAWFNAAPAPAEISQSA